MTIVRAPRQDRFTVVNRTVIADDRLSFRALGLLIYLLDKPDNWRVEAAALAHGEGREGRDAVRTALTELQDTGYLVRRRERNDKGQWITESFVYESPGHAEDGFPGVGDPTPEIPMPGNPAVGNPVSSSKTEIEDGERRLSSSSAADAEFETWWIDYPKKKTGKGEARAKWRKMTKADRAAAFEGLARHVAWWAEHETDPQFIPAGIVWLNGRRWEDEEPRARLAEIARPTSMMDRVKAKLAAERDATQTEAK